VRFGHVKYWWSASDADVGSILLPKGVWKLYASCILHSKTSARCALHFVGRADLVASAAADQGAEGGAENIHFTFAHRILFATRKGKRSTELWYTTQHHKQAAYTNIC
jgi:hypothetical protein